MVLSGSNNEVSNPPDALRLLEDRRRDRILQLSDEDREAYMRYSAKRGAFNDGDACAFDSCKKMEEAVAVENGGKTVVEEAVNPSEEGKTTETTEDNPLESAVVKEPVKLVVETDETFRVLGPVRVLGVRVRGGRRNGGGAAHVRPDGPRGRSIPPRRGAHGRRRIAG